MNQQLNTSLFNESTAFATTELGSIHLNGYSLMTLCDGETNGIIIQNMNPYDIVAELDSYASTISDGGGVLNKLYSNKTITLSLFIQGTSQSDLIARIDELKKETQGVEIPFGITVAGEYRTYTATVSGIRVPAFKRYADFVEGVEMDLLITSPLWEKDAVQEARLGLTGDINIFIENEGTYTTMPKVYIVGAVGCALTNVKITTKQAGEPTGYELNIATTLGSGDLLLIDYKNATVQKNGVDVNFTGIMRPLFVGSNVLEMDFTGSVALDTTVIYNPTFL